MPHLRFPPVPLQRWFAWILLIGLFWNGVLINSAWAIAPLPLIAQGETPAALVQTEGGGDRPQLTPLADRLQQFPHWKSFPVTQKARGDLFYPDWFAGAWEVQTTLVDLVAPLAPEIRAPGFEGNRQGLNQTITFQARFVPEQAVRTSTLFSRASTKWVSDRAFNGLNLAKATLKSLGQTGKSPILAVKVDPTNPNRQITLLRQDRQLVSTVTARAIEAPSSNQFLTTEIFQQEFRGTPQIYFNIVENTTAYTRQLGDNPAIAADQVTAVYLSPQDPDYFKAGDRPVALYRYRLEFRKNN